MSLTLPQWTPEREGIAFLESKQDWLRRQLGGIAASRVVGLGGTVLLAGQEMTIVAGKRRGVRQHGTVLEVAPERPVGPQLRAFLRNEARAALVTASDKYAARIGRRYARITLRDTRSRWGSCTADAGLMYSWRLVMAPPEVLDYVAAHEVAHLQEMNHSQAFWDIVGELCPHYAVHRSWLRRNGDQLHRYTFDD